MRLLCFIVCLVGSLIAPTWSTAATMNKPNILFIAMDDLNDWIGCMGGHPQSKTPNLDRLAATSVLFTNAHCAAPSCNPSRTAIFTGLAPHRSGVYSNAQKMREFLPDTKILPDVLRDHGYHSSGSGKMLHYFIDAKSWDEYYPEAETENPFPRTLYPETRPVSLPRKPWMYVETDWGGLDASDEEFGGDHLVATWISKQLSQSTEKPFFLACGIYRPHEPWFVPKAYFDLFPLESIQLPPGFQEDDLEDLPPEGQRRGPNRYFAHIREQGQWKQAIQGYLASIAFADTQLGIVLDALENSRYRDNTIVVLWSDHGWHLGEKQHWQKYTGWRVCTRVPLMIRAPKGSPGLPDGTSPSSCDQPVSLLSLFPTLLELCGLPPQESNDGISLVPLLRSPSSPWDHLALTLLDRPGNFSLSGLNHRYIHYEDGGEELYDIRTDPYEWHNRANDPNFRGILEHMRARSPQEFAPLRSPSIESLNALKWTRLDTGESPPFSQPEGSPFFVHFVNPTETAMSVWLVETEGSLIEKGIVKPGDTLKLSGQPGSVWTAGSSKDSLRGWVRVGDRNARAVIPTE